MLTWKGKFSHSRSTPSSEEEACSWWKLLRSWCAGVQDLGPDLTYVRISGYGQTGPKAKLPGYASVCEGYGGLR